MQRNINLILNFLKDMPKFVLKQFWGKNILDWKIEEQTEKSLNW